MDGTAFAFHNGIFKPQQQSAWITTRGEQTHMTTTFNTTHNDEPQHRYGVCLMSRMFIIGIIAILAGCDGGICKYSIPSGPIASLEIPTRYTVDHSQSSTSIICKDGREIISIKYEPSGSGGVVESFADRMVAESDTIRRFKNGMWMLGYDKASDGEVAIACTKTKTWAVWITVGGYNAHDECDKIIESIVWR